MDEALGGTGERINCAGAGAFARIEDGEPKTTFRSVEELSEVLTADFPTVSEVVLEQDDPILLLLVEPAVADEVHHVVHAGAQLAPKRIQGRRPHHLQLDASPLLQ